MQCIESVVCISYYTAAETARPCHCDVSFTCTGATGEIMSLSSSRTGASQCRQSDTAWLCLYATVFTILLFVSCQEGIWMSCDVIRLPRVVVSATQHDTAELCSVNVHCSLLLANRADSRFIQSDMTYFIYPLPTNP